jgi:hypothetical protein
MGTNRDSADCPVPGSGDVMVSFRMADGSEVCRELGLVRASDVVRGVPWRTVRGGRGQRHYPGWYWSATTGGHVAYESLLELSRLLVADFAADVVGIAAQPFRVRARLGDRVRWHVPDFLLVHADESVRVVDVKPAAKLADPKVAAALAWPGRLVEARGWEYEVWSGEDPVVLGNLRFLAGYRRPGMVPGHVLEAALSAVRPGDCIGSLGCRLAAGDCGADAKVAVLRLLWEHRLVTDLQRSLDADSLLEVPA